MPTPNLSSDAFDIKGAAFASIQLLASFLKSCFQLALAVSDPGLLGLCERWETWRWRC